MEQPKIKLFRVLYNCGCNDYSFDDEFFSDLFIKTFIEKYGGTEYDVVKYFSTRKDPRILKIYDLLGEQSNKRGDEGYSSLKVTYFPEELSNYLDVRIFEGREHLDVDKLKLYKEFYDRIIVNTELIAFEAIKEHYQRLEYVIREYYKEHNKKKPMFETNDIFYIEQ